MSRQRRKDRAAAPWRRAPLSCGHETVWSPSSEPMPHAVWCYQCPLPGSRLVLVPLSDIIAAQPWKIRWKLWLYRRWLRLGLRLRGFGGA